VKLWRHVREVPEGPVVRVKKEPLDEGEVRVKQEPRDEEDEGEGVRVKKEPRDAEDEGDIRVKREPEDPDDGFEYCGDAMSAPENFRVERVHPLHDENPDYSMDVLSWHPTDATTIVGGGGKMVRRHSHICMLHLRADT
jgi:hypothetical protein